MISLPIPHKRSPVRYRELTWRGRNLGDLVSQLTRGKQRGDFRAHLDPDLRYDARAREPGWRPAFGQVGIAQGHLRKQGVGIGDLFLFWGIFRAVDEGLRWRGPSEHRLWGWLQIGAVAPVDDVVRSGGAAWEWARAHPHWHKPTDPTNTLYVGAERLSLPGRRLRGIPGSGVFDFAAPAHRLTRDDATSPMEWSLPLGFLPRARPPLTYHKAASRWSQSGDRAHLTAVTRGQEFVLNLDYYPELVEWLAEVIGQPFPRRRMADDG